MTQEDLEQYNAEWLAAWTAKDVPTLVAFYTKDCIYRDPQTAAGLKGRMALTAYLSELFSTAPAMTYTPDQVWAIDGGFCGRWYCNVAGGTRLRGFDLVLLKRGKIALNEVYVHPL